MHSSASIIEVKLNVKIQASAIGDLSVVKKHLCALPPRHLQGHFSLQYCDYLIQILIQLNIGDQTANKLPSMRLTCRALRLAQEAIKIPLCHR
jgi:hypothetical protein